MSVSTCLSSHIQQNPNYYYYYYKSNSGFLMTFSIAPRLNGMRIFTCYVKSTFISSSLMQQVIIRRAVIHPRTTIWGVHSLRLQRAYPINLMRVRREVSHFGLSTKWHNANQSVQINESIRALIFVLNSSTIASFLISKSLISAAMCIKGASIAWPFAQHIWNRGSVRLDPCFLRVPLVLIMHRSARW